LRGQLDCLVIPFIDIYQYQALHEKHLRCQSNHLLRYMKYDNAHTKEYVHLPFRVFHICDLFRDVLLVLVPYHKFILQLALRRGDYQEQYNHKYPLTRVQLRWSILFPP